VPTLLNAAAPQTIGLGMLGGAREGSGRLRVVASQQKMKLNAKAMKKHKAKYFGTATAVNGLSSTLAFTPVQGIELSNPSVQFGQTVDTKSGTESYFSEYSGFRSVGVRQQGTGQR
jgi:U4/U6 small nuclear ribonucleoprotein PRP31